MESSEPDETEPSPEPGGPRWRLVASLALGVGLGVAGLAAFEQAFDAECHELPREDLSLAEMGQLRRRVDQYKSDPSVPLTLTAREASFLLREEFDLPVWMTVADNELELEVRLAQLGGCWNLRYAGDLAVHDGVARVRPREVVIGHLSLTGLLAGVSWDVVPAQLPLPRATELLEHTTSAVLLADGIQVRIDEPGWLR
jgi:hypothetical protein